MSGFKKATRKNLKLRMALCGPPGTGKTFTALLIASSLGQRVAVIDTEFGSASKYADRFDFDVMELSSFSPLTYVDALTAAEKEGYDVVIVDSLSHAWVGQDGALQQVDDIANRSKSGNKFNAWGQVTPLQNQMITKLLSCNAHLIVTMRSKTEYVQEKNERTGKTEIRKVGLAPVQRDGVEYEFDIVGDMDQENTLVITKSRCFELSGKVIRKPGKPVAESILAWVKGDGASTPEEPQPVFQNGKDAKSFGHRLREKLLSKESELVKQKTCKEGDLLLFVGSQGVKRYGQLGDIVLWKDTFQDDKGHEYKTGDVVLSLIKEFVEERTQALEPEEQPAGAA